MTAGQVVVADAELVPQFPVYRTLRTCEEAIELLEQTAVAELWLRADLTDSSGVTTLIEFLEMEDQWEGRSQIDTVVVLVEDDNPTDIERRLEGKYALRRERLTPELFTVQAPG